MIYGITLGTKDVLKVLHFQNFLRSIGLHAKIKPQMNEADFARAMLSGFRKANYSKLEEIITKDNQPVLFKAKEMTFVAGVPKKYLDEGMTKEEAASLIQKALSAITNKYFTEEYLVSRLEFIDI